MAVILTFAASYGTSHLPGCGASERACYDHPAASREHKPEVTALPLHHSRHTKCWPRPAIPRFNSEGGVSRAPRCHAVGRFLAPRMPVSTESSEGLCEEHEDEHLPLSRLVCRSVCLDCKCRRLCKTASVVPYGNSWATFPSSSPSNSVFLCRSGSFTLQRTLRGRFSNFAHRV